MPEFQADLNRVGLSAYKTYILPSTGCMVTAALDNGPFIDFLRNEAKNCELVIQSLIATKAMLKLKEAVPGVTLAASRFNLVEEVNDKAEMRPLFERYRSLPGGCCESAKEIESRAKDLRVQGYRKLVLKDPSPYLAAGKSKIAEVSCGSDEKTFKYNLDYLLRCYEGFRGKKKVILEPWYDSVVSSPSVTGHITPDRRIHYISTTTQHMELDDKTEYKGSIIPTESEGSIYIRMMEIYLAIAEYLVERGWIGVFCIDFIVVRNDDGSLFIVPTEINGRYTASMYVANVMRRLDITDWYGYSSNLRVSNNTCYETFRTAIELVSTRQGEIILPFNVGMFNVGKASVMVFLKDRASSPRLRAEEICKEIESMCSTQYAYRDYSKERALISK
jgi:hypothetical protein